MNAGPLSVTMTAGLPNTQNTCRTSCRRGDAERYKAVLASVGQSPAYYENSLRRSLLIHQVQAGLQDSALRLPQRLDALSALLNQRRSFAWVVGTNGIPAFGKTLCGPPIDDGATPSACRTDDARAGQATESFA